MSFKYDFSTISAPSAAVDDDDNVDNAKIIKSIGKYRYRSSFSNYDQIIDDTNQRLQVIIVATVTITEKQLQKK